MGYCSSSIDFENVRSGNNEPSTYEIRHGKTVRFGRKNRGKQLVLKGTRGVAEVYQNLYTYKQAINTQGT